MLGIGLFYDKFCNIYTSSYSTIDGSRMLVKTLLKEGVECSFWKSSAMQNYTKTGIASQTNIEKLFALLPGENTDIRQGMQIDIFEYLDGENVELGQFIIENIFYNRDSRGNMDNIELIIYSRP